MEKITSIVDGDIADTEIVNAFDIEYLCCDGRYAFVGYVNKGGRMLVSCPKHFMYRDDEDIKLIIQCIIKSFRQTDKGSTDYIDCNIPFRAYLHILDYYYKHGLYMQATQVYRQGFSGKIDWNRTIRKSQKIISGDNLLFLPFEVKQIERKHTFIGECMRFVINDGYIQFGKYAGVGELIDNEGYSYNFSDRKNIVKQLKEEEGKHFRDSEIQLIRTLMQYFKWEGSMTEKSFFVTQSFALAWETMVNNYLNINYYGYEDTTERIIFKRNCYKYVFEKQTEYVETSDKQNHKFHVEYDHLSNCISDGRIIVFDSKYYNRISELNYKQVAYHYFLMNDARGNVKAGNSIINGLILPTEGEYESRVHLDRRNIDGVYIQEHYLNLREVMECFAN